MICKPQRLKWRGVFLLLAFTLAVPTHAIQLYADDPPAEQETSGAPDASEETLPDEAEPSEVLTTPRATDSPWDTLATQVQSNASLRWISLFGSQIARLVPDDYRPITVQELTQTLEEFTDNSDPESSDGLTQCDMVATIRNGSLISNASRMKLSEQAGNRQTLGKVSFAVLRLREVDEASGRELVSDAFEIQSTSGGTLTLASQSSEETLANRELAWDWKQQGTPTWDGMTWNLTLPHTVIARIWIRIPNDQRLTCEQAVVLDVEDNKLPEWLDPADSTRISLTSSSAASRDGSDDEPQRWVFLESAGSQTLDLRLRPRFAPASTENPATVLRDCRMTYRFDGSVLSWEARLKIDPQPIQSIPAWIWLHSDVTEVRVDDREVSFHAEPVGNVTVADSPNSTSTMATRVELDVPADVEDVSSTESRTITVTGTVPVASKSNHINLPEPVFSSETLISATPWQIQWSMPRHLNVARWDLPDGWQTTPPASNSKLNSDATTDSGDSIWTATGPSPINSSAAATLFRKDETVDGEPLIGSWQLELAKSQIASYADHQARFLIEDNTIQARCVIRVKLTDDQLVPIQLEAQDGFTFESISVGTNQRTVAINAPNRRGRRLTIWPGPDEVETNDNGGPTLTIRATGQRRRPPNQPQIPSLWMIRVVDCPGQLTAAVIPPADMGWTAETAISPARIEFSDLSIEQRREFAPLPGDAIVLSHAIDQTPPLTLETPDSTITGSCLSRLTMVPRGLQQELRIQVEGLPQTARRIKVRMASQSKDFPPEKIDWQVQLTDSATPTSIAKDEIQRVWVPRQTLPNRQSLTTPNDESAAATNLPMDDPESPASESGWFEWTIPVPRPFGDQSTLIGICTYANDSTPTRQLGNDETQQVFHVGLFRLSEATSQTCELQINSSLQLARPTPQLVGIPSLQQSPRENLLRYRYESTPHLVVSINTRSKTPPSNLVLRQNTHVVASASGTDIAHTRFEMVATQPIEVSLPWDAHLISTELNGTEAIPEHTRQHHLRFATSATGAVTLDVHWSTTSFERSWIRETRVNDLQAVGLTLGNQLNITPAEDSLILPWIGSDEHPRLIFLQWVIGIGWVSALGILALSLWVGWQARWGLACGLALSLFAVLLWPETFVSMTAWVALPLTLALLKLATQHWQLARRATSSDSSRSRVRSNFGTPASKTAESDPTSDFSSSALLPSCLIWLSLFGFSALGTGPVFGQTMDILVPLDTKNQPMGDKAYIPESLYEDLFLVRPDEREQPISFSQASYELDFTSERSKRAISLLQEDSPIELVARFALETPRVSSRLRLPFPLDTVEEVVLVRADDTTRVLTRASDERGGTLVVVPSGTQFDLRVRLRCETTHSPNGTLVEITLPQLPQARLVIRRDYRISNFRVVTDDVAWPTVDRAIGFGIISSNQFAIGPCQRLQIQVQSKPTADALASGVSPASPSFLSVEDASPDTSTAPWNFASQWRRRYWVNATSRHCSVECELAPLQQVPSGGEVVLRFDPDTRSTPRLISRAWRVLKRETHQWKLTRVSEADLPIRLVWDLSESWSQANQLDDDEDGSSNDVSSNEETSVAEEAPSAEETSGERTLNCPDVELTNRWIDASGDQSIPTPSRQSFGETFVAWTLSSELLPVWPVSLGIERTAPEQFYAQWTGTISRIDRASKSSGSPPSVRIRLQAERPLVIESRQEIHLDASGQHMRLEATIAPTTIDASPSTETTTTPVQFQPNLIKVVLPPKTQLFDWTIRQPGLPDDRPSNLASPSANAAATSNNENADNSSTTNEASSETARSLEASRVWTLIREGNRDCLLIQHEGRGLELELDANLTIPKNSDTRLGLIDITPVHQSQPVQSRNNVILSRAEDTTIRWKSEPTTPNQTDVETGPAAMLAAGKILVNDWLVEGSVVDELGNAQFRVNQSQHPFLADTRVSLRWEEGRWTAQTDIQLQSKRKPDFLDVEMPSRWCDALQIQPLCASTRQPTLTPARQVLRIRMADKNIRHLRLTSRLAAGDLVRVSVPKIRVLMAQRSRMDIVVPNRLTNAAIRWETNGVDPLVSPRWELTQLESGEDQSESDSLQDDVSFFRVSNENWSVELEPLRKTNNVARALLADHQVLDDRYMISRYDILPGDASSLTLQLPDGVRFISGWVNRLPADIVPIDDQELQFLLPLSRLSQGIEILSELTPEFDRAEMLGWKELDSAEQNTFTRLTSRLTSNHHAEFSRNLQQASTIAPLDSRQGQRSDSDQKDAASQLRWQAITPSQRWQILATHTVRSIAATADSLADRRDEEVAAWIRTWLQRYDALCRSAGVGFDPLNADAPESQSLEQMSNEFSSRPADAIFSWDEMEAYLSLQVQRYAANESDAWWRTSETVMFADGQWSAVLTEHHPDRWLTASQYWSSDPSFPPPWSSKPRTSMSLAWAQHGMRALLLLTSAGLLIVLRLQPSRNHSHQADWVQRMHQLVNHPSTWIFVLGCIALVLAPFPVAIALMVTAIMLSGFESLWTPLRKRLRVWASALTILFGFLCTTSTLAAQEAEAKPKRIIAETEQAPTADEVQRSLQFHDGWQLQLVASEPMILDPVSAAFDPQGRLWVVEMADYPLPLAPSKRHGRIRVLTDTNRDGRMDQAKTFASQLDFATGVLPWPVATDADSFSSHQTAINGSKQNWNFGAIVTSAGQIAWHKDTTGDGHADQVETWFHGFAIGNEQLRANHPVLGPNGCIYVANGLRGGSVESVDKRFSVAKEPLALTKHDFYFHPISGEWGRVTGNSQHGLSVDDYGRRIGCSNRNPAIQAVLQAQTVDRSRLSPSDAIHDVASTGENSLVRPLADAWTTSHLHAGQFSAACGVLANDDDSLYVCEPTASAVQRQQLSFSGDTWQSQRVQHHNEWLASTHTWFRPVDLVADLGGSVLVVDMARAVIEHPDWAPDELKERPDTRYGTDLGRIWRMTPTPAKRSPVRIQSIKSALESLRSADPVRRTLGHQFLIHLMAERRAPETSWADQTLASMAAVLEEESIPTATQARLALTLAKSGQLTESQRNRLRGSEEPRLRAIAASMSDPASENQELVQLDLLRDPSSLVRQVALESFLNTSRCQEIAQDPSSESFHQVISELERLAGESESSAWIGKLLTTIPSSMQFELLRRVLVASDESRQTLSPTSPLVQTWLEQSAASHLSQTLDLIQQQDDALSQLTSIACWVRGTTPVVARKTLVLGNREWLADLQSLAENCLSAPSQSIDRKQDAVTFLGLVALNSDVLRAQLEPASPEALRSSVLQILLQHDQDWTQEQLLRHSGTWRPSERRVACRHAEASPEFAGWLMQSIQSGQLPRTFVDAGSLETLRRHRDAGIREQVAATFAPPADRAKVLQEYAVVAERFWQADVENGRKQFAQHCSNCHRMEGVGHVVGPDISDSRTKSAESLLLAILNPDAAIDASFTRYQVLTVDGEIVSGLLSSEDTDSVTLLEAETKLRHIERQDIESFRSMDASLMPSGLEQSLSIEQMADLVAYLKRWRYNAEGS
ncbi:PVC-type heme-binding CxxCH protein [Rhodopirellula halodulae]|uniref:PVC-type heme-binding CxxCH protein n=1 Tax=Rhodopirellula halodulae TaxID=2894198 RepID=UPI001E492A10|nr:PVC-type heme-binding CxxCH protein [Rhodopirellula sp. JC737]MCC9657512.1 c-type cytochrome [Rhodopirellula sp. JC737]